MKSKLLLFALLLMGVSARAQIELVSVSEDCSKNGQIRHFKDGHEYVDLGLSVKWAACNVGATTPEGYGNYYAWGEVTTKDAYSWSTYKYSNGSYSSMTKYCTNSSYGTVDNKTTLEPVDDVAHVNWGGNWRIPTKAEWSELYRQCIWTWTTLNGINGYRVTANNGNSIFLPVAGYRDGANLYDAGSEGIYWSSSLDTYSPCYADSFIFFSGTVGTYCYFRYYGRSVRSVCP